MAKATLLKTISIISFVSFSSITYSLDKKNAMNNLAHELAECSAYFMLSSDSARKAGNQELAKKLDKVSEAMISSSASMSSEAVSIARFKMAIKEQTKLINNDYANFSLLMLEFNDVCSESFKHPEKRIEYWLSK